MVGQRAPGRGFERSVIALLTSLYSARLAVVLSDIELKRRDHGRDPNQIIHATSPTNCACFQRATLRY